MNNFLRVGFLPYFITAKLTKNSVVLLTTLFLFILLGQLLYHCLFLYPSYCFLAINKHLHNQFAQRALTNNRRMSILGVNNVKFTWIYGVIS